MDFPDTWADCAETNAKELRELFGRFLTGVTVVTLHDEEGNPRGFTANSFTSVSLDPPLVLVCIGDKAGSHDAFVNSKRFGVNILSEAQRDISTVFASRSEDRFAKVETIAPGDAAPMIEGSLGSLDCEMHSVVQAGDHSIVIGRVLRFRTNLGAPLGYYRGSYVAFGLGSTVLESAAGSALEVGGLLEHEGHVLLCRRPGSDAWGLPSRGLGQGDDHRQLLPRLLETLGLKAGNTTLYSIYQGAGEPHVTMVFRGQVSEPPEPGLLADGTELRFFNEEERPWEHAVSSSTANMVRRYFRERREARLGIYWEIEGGGQVASLEGMPHPWSPVRPNGTHN